MEKDCEARVFFHCLKPQRLQTGLPREGRSFWCTVNQDAGWNGEWCRDHPDKHPWSQDGWFIDVPWEPESWWMRIEPRLCKPFESGVYWFHALEEDMWAPVFYNKEQDILVCDFEVDWHVGIPKHLTMGYPHLRDLINMSVIHEW